MAFGSIEITTITRSQDYTTIKHNQDNKVVTDQNNSGIQVQKQTQELTKEVHSGNNAEWYKKKPDAKEKGNGGYSGDGGQKRKKKQQQEQQSRVVLKGRQGFDIRV